MKVYAALLITLITAPYAFAADCEPLKVDGTIVTFKDDGLSVDQPGKQTVIEITSADRAKCKNLKVAPVKDNDASLVEVTYENGANGTKMISVETQYILVNIKTAKVVSEPIVLAEEIESKHGITTNDRHKIEWKKSSKGSILQVTDEETKKVSQAWPTTATASPAPAAAAVSDSSRKNPPGISDLESLDK